ncbi:MAG: YhgE/Pip domain-containing protein [Rubrivivax sp.]|nr:YhgE/Pip domain-containing protein [Rubrivivax sp.]
MIRRLRAILATADATARFDLAFFRTHVRFVAAIAIFLLIPALYAFIYLSSLWDPAALTRNLTVIVVNQDRGTQLGGAPVDVGRGLVEGLGRDTRFTYRLMAEPSLALHEVDQGLAVFAVLIPPEFSQRAMEASQVGAARFVVHASEGNSVTGAGFAQRFALEMSERLNQAINEQRFAAMLQIAGGSRTSLDQLREAVSRLTEGAGQVATGAQKAREAGAELSSGLGQLEQGGSQVDQGARGLDAAARQLADGLQKVGTALESIRGRLPEDQELLALRQGAGQLQTVLGSLSKGLQDLEQGAQRLRDGHGQLAAEAADIPFVGESLSEATLKLREGSEQLRQGLQTAAGAGQQANRGAERLAQGVDQLTKGFSSLDDALHQLQNGLPSAATLDAVSSGGSRLTGGSARLAQGAGDLAEGSRELQRGLQKLDESLVRLRDGLVQLQLSLPHAPSPPEGTAAGLSESVKPALQFSAPVANQGTALTPSFVPLSLWIGATLCAVLFAYHCLPAPLAGQSGLGIVLGKLATPALVVIGQALILAAVLIFLLNVRVANPGRFLLTLMLTALSFAALLFVLVRLFGNAGKLVAVILLAIQLAASGTMVPVELTSPFFQAIHPWLPLTWAIKATRIAMFDAYEGAWLQSTLAMLGLLVATVLISAWAGRWRVVETWEYRPLVD